MPEESANTQSQTIVLTQPPRRSPLKIILFIAFGLIVLVLVVEGVYFLRLRKGGVVPVPIIPLKPEKVVMETIDILTLPGWSRPPSKIGEVKTNPDGSLKTISEPGTRWHQADNYALSFQVKGNFEARFGLVTAGRQNPEQRQWGKVLFHNAHFTKEPNWVEVGINPEGEVVVSFLDNKKKESIDLIKDVFAPSSGNLKIKFEKVMSGLQEEVIVYDQDTGVELGRAQLPLPLFSQDLYLGLALGNISKDPKGAEMTVSHFKILGNVTKI